LKNVLIRADSGFLVGAGHIMRTLALAKRDFKKDKIFFVTKNLKGNLNRKIKNFGYKIIYIKKDSIREFLKIIDKTKANTLIIDHYEIDYRFEKILKQNRPKTELIAIDDLYKKHYCDILINHNIYAKKEKYKNLTKKSCKIRCGIKHILLRDEFIKAKKILKRENRKFTLFLAMGGADTANLNIKILEILKDFDVFVNVVTTKANRNLKELKNYSKNREWMKLYIEPKNIAVLMKKSDFAIVTPSVILNEIFFLKIPFLAIQTAFNQNMMVEYLQKNGYRVFKKFEPKKLRESMKTILKERDEKNDKNRA